MREFIPVTQDSRSEAQTELRYDRAQLYRIPATPDAHRDYFSNHRIHTDNDEGWKAISTATPTIDQLALGQRRTRESRLRTTGN